MTKSTVLIPTIRTIVFHRQPIVADGIAMLLSMDSAIEVAGVVLHPAGLATAVSRTRPDVVVLGCGAVGPSQLEQLIGRVVAACADHRPEFVVIVSDSQEAADTLAIDAKAVVTTGVTGRLLRELVRSVGDGTSNRVPAELVRPHPTPLLREADPVGALLTVRENEVLIGIESGLSTREIAQRLGISVNTTRTHAQRLMTKMHVHSRLRAAAVAAEHRHLAAPEVVT